MILPCPLRAGAQVELLDLSKDRFKFASLHACFPTLREPVSLSRGEQRKAASASSESRLAVRDVGAYKMSVAPLAETRLGPNRRGSELRVGSPKSGKRPLRFVRFAIGSESEPEQSPERRCSGRLSAWPMVADLARIDPAVFVVADNIEKLMAAQYGSGFAFVVCMFDPSKDIKPHPIGYVHDLLPDGRSLFVPCRHEHGDGTKATETFDHAIFSLGAKADPQSEAGPTPVELGEQLQKRNEALGGKGHVAPAARLPADAMKDSQLLFPLIAPAVVTVLRRSELRGPHPNQDLVFQLAIAP